MVTVVIMEPPVRNGGIAFSSSRLPVQPADAGGAEHLVPGEDGEVDVQRLDVQRQVRRGLAGVQHHERRPPAGPGAPARPPG